MPLGQPGLTWNGQNLINQAIGMGMSGKGVSGGNSFSKTFPGMGTGMGSGGRYSQSASSNFNNDALLSVADNMMGREDKMSRFNQIFPWIQGQMGQMSSRVGGHSGAGPHIAANPVFNAQQIQQQVNSQRAANDQSTAGQINDMSQRMAGRGFGTMSPLAQSLATQMNMGNLATNTGNERDIRLNSAQANASQLLKGQTAQEAQFASRMQEDIERRRTMASSMNALIGQLGGLM